jgi:hypothetical protein
MRLSIIIPTFNEEQWIERTLRVLKERAAGTEIYEWLWPPGVNEKGSGYDNTTDHD